jgi:hypothetical protein
MQIVEHSPKKITLRDRHPIGGLFALLFGVISVVALTAFWVQILQMFPQRIVQHDGALWLLVVVVFTVIGVSFITLAVMGILQFWVGTACVLDRDAEQVIFQSVDFLKPKTEHFSIYGVSHVQVEHNDELSAYSVWMVFKTGRRIPLTVYPDAERDAMQKLVLDLRQFLITG